VKKDNQTFNRKVALRLSALKEIPQPVVLETHGGAGKIYQACYSDIKQGVVFEKNPEKASLLSRQRQTWSVYECDSTRSIAEGAGAHLPVNLLDCDPYGSPWDVIDAFLFSERPKAEKLWIVVNDGLRVNIKMKTAWKIAQLAPLVASYGNDLYGCYLGVCEELLKAKASQVGYDLRGFRGYYCGFQQNMAHYAARLERGAN
jgi:hypothetical protein